LSRNKKKKKIAGQNLSLTERLERHWDNEKWESFFSLYMRDRDASERGPWAAKFPDALYNCLTAALFLHKNYDGARQVAEMMLAEGTLGPDSGVLQECARTAIDFINIREGKSYRPDGEGLGIVLPEPYEELRRKLTDAFATLKRGRKKKEISNPTVEKLAKQFTKLPFAKNSASYSSFSKTAETLVSETEGSDSAAIFRAVRDIASAMLGISRGILGSKDPTRTIRGFDSKDYPLRAGHPALLTLWEYMCKQGGRKFGEKWENAARVGRMSVISLGEEFKPAYDKLLAAKKRYHDETSDDLPMLAERYYGGWTEQERFILIFLAVTDQLKNSHLFFDDIPESTILRWFKTLGEIGGGRRSGRAWPDAVKFALEKMLITGGSRYSYFMAGEDLPYECMSTATIAVMLLYAPHTLKFVEDRLKSRLPLSMSEKDEYALDHFYPGTVFPVPTLIAVSGLLDDIGKGVFFKYILLGLFRQDATAAIESAVYRPSLWKSVSQAHMALFLECLPDNSFAAAFCRLCRGQKPMSISDDKPLIDAFFSSSPEHGIFNAMLSTFLMTWPRVPVEFTLRLFEFSIEEQERMNTWDLLTKIVSKIQNADDRKNVARGVSLILRRRHRKNMSADIGLAVKALVAVEKNGCLPEEKDDDDNGGYFDNFDSDLIRLFERFSRKKKMF
jgi:hypothetical protein